MEAYLQKQSPSGLRSWQKRLVSLHTDLLAYYKKKGDMPIGQALRPLSRVVVFSDWRLLRSCLHLLPFFSLSVFFRFPFSESCLVGVWVCV